MARPGLFSKIQPPPGPPGELLARVQDNVALAVNRLTADDDLLRVPVARLSASGVIPATAGIVVYAGGAGNTLTLPQAAAQGPSLGAFLFLLNISASAVTVARTGADTVAGGASVTLAAGALVILASDGASRWLKTT